MLAKVLRKGPILHHLYQTGHSKEHLQGCLSSILSTIQSSSQIPYPKGETPPSEQVAEELPAEEVYQERVDVEEVLISEGEAYGQPIVNPFEDPTARAVEEITEEPWIDEGVDESPPKNEIEAPIVQQADAFYVYQLSPQQPSRVQSPETITLLQERSMETLDEQQPDELNLEQLLPQQSTRAPAPETLALLREDDQPRGSTKPEIDKLLRTVAQDNESLSDKPLFWSDFRPVDPEIERAMSPPPLREHSVREVSPDRQIVDGPPMLDQRDRTLSPLRRNPVVDVAPVEAELFSPKLQEQIPTEQREQSPPQPESMEQRNISPLRRNPQMRNITSLLTENEALAVS